MKIEIFSAYPHWPLNISLLFYLCWGVSLWLWLFSQWFLCQQHVWLWPAMDRKHVWTTDWTSGDIPPGLWSVSESYKLGRLHGGGDQWWWETRVPPLRVQHHQQLLPGPLGDQQSCGPRCLRLPHPALHTAWRGHQHLGSQPSDPETRQSDLGDHSHWSGRWSKRWRRHLLQ